MIFFEITGFGRVVFVDYLHPSLCGDSRFISGVYKLDLMFPATRY
jgi:hypothetical protein